MSKRDKKRKPQVANMVSEFIGKHEPASVDERFKLRGHWTVEKFRDGEKYEQREANNCPLNVGLAVLLDLGFGLGGAAFNNANSRIVVGTDATAADPTQTGAIAALHNEPMDATYPVRVGQTVTVRSTFAAGHGTGAWREVVFDNGTTALVRLVYDAGTKGASDVWIVTGTFTLS